jgi:alginate O-acetyltransferase complex protein AlgI
MNTATAARIERRPNRAVFFDASCRLCAGAAARWRKLLERHGFAVFPLQSGVARQALGLGAEELPQEMKVISDECLFGGADALIEIARRIWWARPLAVIGSAPPVRNLLRRAYAELAKRRNCLNKMCRISTAKPSSGPAWIGWLPLLLLTLASLPFRQSFPHWVFMCLLASSLFVGCKWLTWSQVRMHADASKVRMLGYLFGWVGMDAKRFMGRSEDATTPALSEWIAAVAKTVLGAILLWCVTRAFPADYLTLRAACGVCGLIFLLHCGTFHLLSLAWRTAGVDAPPIMRAPLRAVSLAEFWNARWNLAFHQLAERNVFRPLLRRTHLTFALLITFVLSGLVHEAVISFPARGGYGLPTGYFLLQGCGVWLERTPFGRRIGLAHGLRGRAFAWLMTLAPVPMLFHEPFRNGVILPTLTAMGAL